MKVRRKQGEESPSALCARELPSRTKHKEKECGLPRTPSFV